MTNLRQAPKKKKKRTRGLPILGLLLAISLAGVAYGIAFPLVQFGEDQSETIKDRFDELRDQFAQREWYQNNEKYHGNNIVEIVVALFLWFLMMGLSMFVVSATLVGTDPERESWKYLPPSPADKKAMVKQLRKDLKEAKRREKEMAKKK
jgi:flagellar basal body-associated protein FliL